MANVREYLRSKEKRKSGNRSINYKEKIRSHKLTIFYRSLLGLLLVGAIVATVFVSWKNRAYSESIMTNVVSVSKVEGASYLSLGTSILTYSKDGANCMDSKGNVLWNRTYEMQNPMVDINGSVVAIGDYNGRTIYVMNETGSMGEITTNMPIRNFCVAENGVVAAILDDADITRINLFDTEGNILVKAETTMDKSGYPIDISLSPNGELLAISYFYVDSGVMKSSVAFHNFGDVGQNQSSDRFVSGYDYQGTIIPFIKFINGNTVFAISDERIMFFTGNQKPVSAAENLLSEEAQGIFYNNQYIGLVFLDTEGESKYRLDVYNTEGKLAGTKKFDIEYKDIIFNNDDIIIYSETEYSVSNIQGVERFRDQFDETVFLFSPTGKTNRFVVMTQDAMNIMEMK
ncbi:DUF5711 family protein [Kineothrix sp. MB12-C1]|uniref:DUF5711 family protein n=1 Tax=Kineothrix sp. MB12-C1 TaxID=3070215 RepID=UPI0027D28CFF|nr:DUF5711 family protein [Kineothrix sp. MB12-C1]WMC94199.1 DUF5711 family protein [Kineothrix sp. MB12-C1]